MTSSFWWDTVTKNTKCMELHYWVFLRKGGYRFISSKFIFTLSWSGAFSCLSNIFCPPKRPFSRNCPLDLFILAVFRETVSLLVPKTSQRTRSKGPLWCPFLRQSTNRIITVSAISPKIRLRRGSLPLKKFPIPVQKALVSFKSRSLGLSAWINKEAEVSWRIRKFSAVI